MTMRLRPVFTLLLALTVAIASVGFAQARHHGAGAQTMVICSGYGMVTITIDATGKKVERSVPCPDCVGVPLAVLPDTLATPSIALTCVQRLTPALAHQARLTLAGHWSHPRAPPPFPV
jgi:hypothetical protein